jgi:sulfonate dioxygenase
MSLTHTGLTEKVLRYQAPDQPVAEFEPAKDRAFFADSSKNDLLGGASRVTQLTSVMPVLDTPFN